MTGSLRPFNYFDDNGLKYLVLRDESNSIAVNQLVDRLFALEVTQAVMLPSRIKMRYLNCKRTDADIYKVFPVSTVQRFRDSISFGFIYTGYPNDGYLTWRVMSYRSEVVRPIVLHESGLDDGTPGLG